MDLTTEAIKELKQAFTALPSLPGTDRVAAAEVLGLLQSLGPASSMPSVDHLFRLIEQVTKEAAAVVPAAAVAQSAPLAPSATAASVLPGDHPDGVRSGPCCLASPVPLPGSPGATSPRAFPARPPLPPPPLPPAAMGSTSPADGDAARRVQPSKDAAATAAAATGGRGQMLPGSARCVTLGDTRIKQAVDAGWGKPPDLASSSDKDLHGDAAAAAAAAAVSRKVVRPSAGGGGAADGGIGGDRAGDARHKGGTAGKHHRRSISEAAVGATAEGAEAVGCGGTAKSPRLAPKAAPPGVSMSVTFGPQVGRKLPPVLPPVSTAGRAAPAPPRRVPPPAGARAASSAAAAAALPSLDFRAFLLVVVRLLHEMEGPAVTGGGVRDPTTGALAGDQQHIPWRTAAPLEDPVDMMSSVFRLLDVGHRGALQAEDLQVVMSGFGGEPVSADQAAAMVELALSTEPGGLVSRTPLQTFGAAVGMAEFAGVYEMVQQANQRRAAEEVVAAAEAAAAAAERGRRHSSSSSGFFKWDLHRREPRGPPSPSTPNGGSPRDVPPLEQAAAKGTGSPRDSAGHIADSREKENGPGGSPPSGGRLRQLAKALTGGERPTSLSGSTSSRASSPRSSSAHSLSSSTSGLTKPGGVPSCATDGATPAGANLV